MTPNLRPLQQRLADAAEVAGRVGWAVEPGYGKTLPAMVVAAWSDAQNVLWVAPKNVVQLALPAEVERWNVLDKRQLYLLGSDDFDRERPWVLGDPLLDGWGDELAGPTRKAGPLRFADRGKTRAHLLDVFSRRRIIGCSYDWLDPLAKALGPTRVFDLVVLDEAHYCKTGGKQGSLRFKAANHLAAGARQLIGMTGTPQTNDWEELWALAFLVDHGATLGRTLTAFRKEYLIPDRSGFRWEVRSDTHAAAIRDGFARLWLGARPDELLQMPELVMNDVMVAIPREAHAAALKLMRGKLATLRGESDLPPSVAAGLNGALQICDGFRYKMELGDRRVIHAHDEKVQAVVDLVDSGISGGILIWYRYQEAKERLAKALGKRIIFEDEKDAVKRWRAGEVQVLGSHPASLGEGQNFQDVGNTMIFFGCPWSLNFWVQCIARMRRPGQTKPVIVHRVMADHPVELAVLDALDGKATLLQALLTRVGR